MHSVRVYHVTHRHNRESILKKGLLPFGKDDRECRWSGLNYSPRICVSLHQEDLVARDWVAHWDIDIWTFLVWKKHLHKDTLSGEDGHYYIEKRIPPARLQLIEHIPPYPERWIGPMATLAESGKNSPFFD